MIAPRMRRGFTLTEILVALVIMAILGVSFVRLITSQSKFSEGQMALRNARTVSRNAMNIMITDLRMVQDKDGLIAANHDSVTLRVPVAFGLLCTTAAPVTASLLPVDSAMTALGQYAGWAYRDSTTGEYTYIASASPVNLNALTAGVATACTAAPPTGPGITPVTYGTRTGRIVVVPDLPTGTPKAGWPMFLFQEITYKFGQSGAFPGRIGLLRRVKTSNPAAPISDEIIAPFDTSAKFRFYVLNADTAQDGVPADLNQVRGLQLVLAGSSPRTPQGEKRAKGQALVTGVFFKNRRDP